MNPTDNRIGQKWDIPLSMPLPTDKYPVYPTEPIPSVSDSKSKGSRFKKMFSSPDKPILEASKNGDANAVASIVRETGPAANRIMDNDNWTPLHWASRKGHSQIVQLLLENRMPVYSRTKSQDREPLFFAAQYGYLETCRLLLAASADPNAYSKMDGATALHRAAIEGHERVCSLLISSGANADARDKEGMGPLMWAVQGDRGPVIQTLVSNGARLEARSEAGMTALHRAVAAKNVPVT
jgi:ankyrin repeat protein